MRASRTNPEGIPNLWQTNPEPMTDKFLYTPMLYASQTVKWMKIKQKAPKALAR